MQLVFEDKASIPVESAGDFEEFTQDDKVVFMHKELVATKKESFRNQGQLTKLTNEFGEFKSRIDETQKQVEEKARLEKETALNEQREKLKASGKDSELHKLELELERTAKQSLETKLQDAENKFSELQTSLVEAKKTDLATKIASKFTTGEFSESVGELLKLSRIKSVNGNVVFTNAGGEAVETNIDQIVQMLQEDPKFKPFAMAPNSKPGIGAKGGQQSASGALDLNKPFSELSTKEKTEFIKRKQAKG